jgi:hypothetical protein
VIFISAILGTPVPDDPSTSTLNACHHRVDGDGPPVPLTERSRSTGVVALANGGWRWSRGDYPLYVIMDRLFDASKRLG